MKRFWIVLMVVAVAMVMALPAAAKKGGIPGPPRDEPVAGTTCTPLWYNNPDVETDDFTVTLEKADPGLCIDVIPPEAGRWWVTVTATGPYTRPSLTLVPRDAVGPGDSCGGVGLRGDVVFGEPIPLPYFEDLNLNGDQDPGEAGDPRFTEIPLATVNACLGNADPASEYQGDFAEFVEHVNGTSDIVFGPTDERNPLALQIFFGGLKRTSTLEVCVDLPPFDDFC